MMRLAFVGATAWAFSGVSRVLPRVRSLRCQATMVADDLPALMHQTFLLADAALADATATVAPAVDAAATVAPVVEEVAKSDDGWFGGIVWVAEQSIEGLHGLLGEGSYGVAIIAFTLVVKALTFPLNYKQLESTTKMQQLQPAVKKIQARYANDPQQLNLMLAQLYEENNLNPLAGCLPALVQIPIFIALYRALLSLAKQDLLAEKFLWLPSLEGPVFGAQNADWIFKFDNWNGFEPPLGWHDTAAYLSLPLILVVAQFISTNLLQPPADPTNPNAQSSNAVLKVLPLMVGFFSLNVPSGLCIYWIINNIVTTASTLYIRKSVLSTQPAPTMGGAQIDLPAAPKKSRVPAEPKTFEDMLAASRDAAPPPPRPKAKPSVAPVIDSADVQLDEPVPVVAADAAPVALSSSDEPTQRSKAAEKKLRKATKTRRAKKSRR